MEGKFCLVTLFCSWLLFLACNAEKGAKSQSQSQLDIRKYGSGSEISKALLVAWKEACNATTPSTILIPQGIFSMNQVKLEGPCKAPIQLRVQGTIKANPDPYQFKEGAWITINYLTQFTLSGGGTFDAQGSTAWKLNDCAKTGKCTKLPNSFSFNFLNDSVVRDITSKDSKLFHMTVLGCNNLQFSRVTITAPETSLNTDGIHIGRSNGVNVKDSVIKTGDDCISIGDGAKQIRVNRVTCGPGHGISVGSLGKYQNEEPVEGIFVRNCTLINTMNGVRVKTWPAAQPGSATNMHFDDIVMQNVSNPIFIDQQYCPSNQCSLSAPSKVKVSKVTFKNITGTSSTPAAVSLICSSTFPCQGVEIGTIDLKFPGGPAAANCSNVKPVFTGTQNPPIVSNAQIFDITKYGAKPGGADISQAMLDAWKAACTSTTPSTVLIPKGTFTLKEIYLTGPCKAPQITLTNHGTVIALPEPTSVKKDNEWIMIQYVDHLTINGNGIYDGVGAKSWGLNKEHCWNSTQCNQFPDNFGLHNLKHLTVRDITSKDSKLFHFIVIDTQNATFQNLKITAPESSPNTDGIHIGKSRQVTIIDTSFKTGDDCVSIGDDTQGVNVTRISCGPGHGISVGSLGKYNTEKPVIGVWVTNSNLSNTMNGVRIKTWVNSQPNEASDMHFENIRMDNVGNPINIDQLYCPSSGCNMNIPSKVKLSKISFKGITGTSSTPVAVSLVCSSTFPCQGVEIGTIDLKFKGGVAQSNCSNVRPAFSGTQNPKLNCR
ncbi:OLC1v1025964C1 [Oldenlandia corymbosa var. corymbosa]|uniref:OLC1v1025964C1 n=1 Tax=Oldenlandia corymbosa var. corymbosa TaxID=529605 RepID=A0AAV1C627_OLDCO|nr:OLC1v1025964C1 [Oldenlandia corymbosa var. corymbosa]